MAEHAQHSSILGSHIIMFDMVAGHPHVPDYKITLVDQLGCPREASSSTRGEGIIMGLLERAHVGGDAAEEKILPAQIALNGKRTSKAGIETVEVKGF